ncbi:MAG: ABC transporter ATP-binding protein [Gemmatimonadetes bacterium]|nr:ABC transporter ATP-binding protein [Gemmatimonadota bacterium]
MIALTGVSKRFGVRTVLDDVSLALRPGAVTALVGPNGSGKTTLIKMILGLTRPDRGALLVCGTPADERGSYRRAIGYMPQLARFPENLTVRHIIALVRALRPDAACDESLGEELGLSTMMDVPFGVLSGGMRQKVNAAIAFLFRPAVLILDEPTAGLDPVATGILKARIRAVRAEGRTVLVTSHVMGELEELADDVAFLCDGRLQFSGTVAELLAETREHRLERAVAALVRRREA